MSKGFDDDDKCIFIGGLRKDKTVAKLKHQLKYLFKCISLNVQKGRILVINSSKSDYCYGFVDLEDADAVAYVLHHLGTQSARDNVHFDFSLIQDPSKRLKFDYKKPPRQLPKFVNNDNNQNEKPVQEDYSNNGVEESTWTAAKKVPFSSPTHQINTIQTSTTGLPVAKLSKPSLPPIQTERSQVSTTTSVGGLVPNMSGRFYHLKEKLGNETRTVEFKQGGFVSNDRKNVLQDNVGKYVCAFLNTEGGTLFVGVDNDGEVVGVSCDQQDEDKHRLSIDQAVKMIRPPVSTDTYTVDFVSVLDQNNAIERDLKVLEIKVKALEEKDILYMYRDDAYIRRDGSVQMLKGRDIQEWERKRQEKLLEGREDVLLKLCERTEQVQLLQEQIVKLERRHNAKKKSRVCSVM